MILKYFRGISYKSPIFPSDTLIKLPGFLEFYRPVIESAEHIIEAIVKNTGMPWWLSISVLTVGVRIINIPFLYLQYRSTSPLAVAMPNYRLLNDIVKNSEASNTEKILISIKTFRQINKTHNIQFSKTFLYGFLQFPQFITFVWAVRSLCGHNNELKTGGTGWFTDLTEPDPYMVLPIISLSFTYFNLQRGIDDSNRNWIINRFKHFVQIWIIITLPISVHWPSGVFCYWATNSVCSYIQSILVTNPKVIGYINPNLAKDVQKIYGKSLAPDEADRIAKLIHTGYEGHIKVTENQIEKNILTYIKQQNFKKPKK